MNITERQQEILNILKERHFASVKEIADEIFTSGATVRRETEKLEKMGIVKAVYGGVVLTRFKNEPVPIEIRDNENSAEKSLIAQKAAQSITDGMTVIFDSSSTVRRMCKSILNKKGLTVITNNLRVLQELKNTNIHVICTGGSLIQRRECFVGPMAEDFIRRLRADAMFFSSQGVNEMGDIVDSSEEETSLRRVMMNISKRHIFLCSSSKLNSSCPFVLCNIRDVEMINL